MEFLAQGHRSPLLAHYRLPLFPSATSSVFGILSGIFSEILPNPPELSAAQWVLDPQAKALSSRALPKTPKFRDEVTIGEAVSRP
jgi:hypothetical protein